MVDLPGTDHPRPGNDDRPTHTISECWTCGQTCDANGGLTGLLRCRCCRRDRPMAGPEPGSRLDRFDAHTTRLGCRHALLNPAHPGPCERDS